MDSDRPGPGYSWIKIQIPKIAEVSSSCFIPKITIWVKQGIPMKTLFLIIFHANGYLLWTILN